MLELKTYNATEEEISANKHLIFIGISVGVKPISKKTAPSYLEWTEKHSEDTIQILIADEIAKFNYLAFSHSTKPGALSRAIRDGDVYQGFFEELISYLPSDRRKRFNLLRWNDIKTPRFYQIVESLNNELETNQDFREALLFFIDQYIKHRQKRVPNKKRFMLCQYLIQELSTLLDGIHVNNKNYRLIFYPTYKLSGMSKLVSDIQTGLLFPHLREKLTLSKTIMVESLIPHNQRNQVST